MLDEPFYIFTYDTFAAVHPNSDNTDQRFEKMKAITTTGLRAQVYFDLIGFYLFSRRYVLARESDTECYKNFTKLKQEYSKTKIPEFLYCHTDESDLGGYLLDYGLSNRPPSLLERLNESILNQFKDIVEILRLDYINREIPLINRHIVELDIEGALSQGILKASKEIEMQVAALNVIRAILDEENMFASVDFLEKYRSREPFTVLIENIADVLPHCLVSDRNKLKMFLINCILKGADSKSSFTLIEGV